MPALFEFHYSEGYDISNKPSTVFITVSRLTMEEIAHMIGTLYQDKPHAAALDEALRAAVKTGKKVFLQATD